MVVLAVEVIEPAWRWHCNETSLPNGRWRWRTERLTVDPRRERVVWMSFGILSCTKMDAIGATWAATWHRVLSGRTRLPWRPRVHLLPCAIGASDWTPAWDASWRHVIGRSIDWQQSSSVN